MRLFVVASIVVLLGFSTVYGQDVSRENPSAGIKTADNSIPSNTQQTWVEKVIPIAEATPAWWSDRAAGFVGGIGGSVIGLMGALIGTLAGMGKARRFVLILSACLIGFGVIILVVGAIALALGQPYAVFYPLLLSGAILTLVFGGIRPGIRKGYEQREFQKMTAMDAGVANVRPEKQH